MGQFSVEIFRVNGSNLSGNQQEIGLVPEISDKLIEGAAFWDCPNSLAIGGSARSRAEGRSG
jgi:hypothetical protein